MNLKLSRKINYLGLRRDSIWCEKIKKTEIENLYQLFYGDDTSDRFFIGNLQDCRIEKKKLLKNKIKLIGRLEVSKNGHKISVLGSLPYYRKRFTMANLLGWFVEKKDKIIKNGGVLVVDENFTAYFLNKTNITF